MEKESERLMNRIDKIKDRLFNKEFVTKKPWWGMNETILTNEEVKKEPLVVRKALGIQYVMRNMPVEIKEDELIIGICTMASTGLGYEFPDYALPEEKEEALKSCYTYKSVWGHHPGDYAKVLKLGLKGIREEIFKKIKEEVKKTDVDVEKLNFYRSMVISLNSVQELANRYAQLAIDMAAREKDLSRKTELIQIAEICTKVPENPSETLQEALQSVYFFMVALQSTLELVPIQRVDQYFYPYYKHDIDLGIIDETRAKELIASWLAKFSERVQIKPEFFEDGHEVPMDQSDGGNPDDFAGSFYLENDQDYNKGTSANQSLMNLIVGGLTPDGKDATNELTYIFIEMWNYLELVQPVASVRFHKNSPQRLYDMVADILRNGAGEPAIYNDEAIIKGLTDMGIPIEDARNYSNDGCWEVLIPGKTNFGFEYVNLLQILEYTLHHGKSLIRNRQECRDVGNVTESKSFDDFYDHYYLPLIRERMEFILKSKLKYRSDRYKIAPSPLLSTIMDDCIEKGRDLSNGGAKYNIYPLMLTGYSNAIDSLLVIKKLVFEEKKVTLQELIDATETNFKDNEKLRQQVINTVPKFGNDDDYADEFSVKVLADMEKLLDKTIEKIDTEDLYIPLGIATFETYMSIGHNIGASCDGRLKSAAVASNYSPSVGVDLNGPTAVIKSVTRPDLTRYNVGCPLDIQINANEAQGKSGLMRLEALIRSFLELGGLILTITGVREEELIDAQIHPMEHKNLRVRMGGLSAYFIALAKEHQDSLISRVKHGI
ncbi:MAG: pyruvate formate lyase family protein [Candidatus Choladocola sp.]|nr:pyruvate formate lyase family protein [Candidatus Choladocola sp.]